MRIPALTEWINSPETRALVAYLRNRQAPTVHRFRLGQPVDPLAQGRAAALYEIERLLSMPSDEARQVIEKALTGELTE